jgi:hypothetical protein
MTKSLSKMSDRLDRELPRKAFLFFKDITPKRTGNARRKTRLQNKTIKAGYPYATKLDKGSSKKAPDGMSKPTTEYLNQLTKTIVRK